MQILTGITEPSVFIPKAVQLVTELVRLIDLIAYGSYKVDPTTSVKRGRTIARPPVGSGTVSLVSSALTTS